MIAARQIAFGSGGGKRLPDGVVQVEYLENAANNYINTGVIIGQYPNRRIEAKFSNCKYVSNFDFYHGLFGVVEDSNGNSTGIKVISNSAIRLRDGRNQSTDIEMVIPASFECSLSRNGAVINGVGYPYIFTLFYSALVSPIDIFGFSNYTDGIPKNNTCGRGRCHYFKIYDGNILLFDAIPVRVGDVGYMYDKVSGQLFGNAGTGEFVLGADI